MSDKQASTDGWGKRLRAQFMAGILVVVPAGATILILIWVFTTIDNILQPIVRAIAGHSIPGVGFGVTVVLIYITGVIARNVIGNRLIKYGDSIMAETTEKVIRSSLEEVLQKLDERGLSLRVKE